MNRRFHLLRHLLLPATLLAAAAACSDATGPDAGRRVSMSFAARGDATAGTAGGSSATQSATGTIVVSGTDTLRLTSVRLIIDELELERGTSDLCDDDGDDNVITVDASCAELEVGPFLVSLPLDGAVSSSVAVALPAGSYHELEMKLRRADSGDDRAFNAAHPEMNGISVLVEGTFRGQPFTWRGNIEAELELDFSPPLVVDGTTNFTVNIDVGRWFRTGAGAIIDPATAAVGQVNFGLVAQNIRASFEVYEDDDRDGDDDSDDDSDDRSNDDSSN